MQTLTAEPVLVPPSHPRDSGMSVSRVRAGLGSALRSVQPARPRCGAAASRQPGLGGNTSTPALSFITSSSLYLRAQGSTFRRHALAWPLPQMPYILLGHLMMRFYFIIYISAAAHKLLHSGSNGLSFSCHCSLKCALN